MDIRDAEDILYRILSNDTFFQLLDLLKSVEEDAYNDGYDQGKKEGYTDGWDEGFYAGQGEKE